MCSKGISVAIAKVDYRGNVYVPNDELSYADFDAEYFFAGSGGLSTSRHFASNYNDDVYLSDSVAALVWSDCGVSTNFRINAAVTAYKANESNNDVQIAVDSQDAQLGGFRYYVQYKSC